VYNFFSMRTVQSVHKQLLYKKISGSGKTVWGQSAEGNGKRIMVKAAGKLPTVLVRNDATKTKQRGYTSAFTLRRPRRRPTVGKTANTELVSSVVWPPRSKGKQV
jgi:hypothetical protein